MVISNGTTICSISRRLNIPRGCSCTTSIQVGEVNNCFRTSYSFTITVIECQFNLFSCCIVFVCLSCCAWVSITGCYTTFISVFTTSSWSNVQFRSFQCFSSVMKVRYINRCILNIRTSISCCFQFIQVCSSLTCRHCWSLVFNSRTNIVNDHAAIFCCLTSCCFRVFERCDDIASIFSCFTNFMEFTVFIFR